MNALQRWSYRRSKEYKKKLDDNFVIVNAVIQKRVDDAWEDDKRRRRDHNDKCPLCGKDKIVNKIARVQGSVSGSFVWGSGSVYGSTDTEAVNHCASCGNEWKKYEWTNITTKRVVKDFNFDLKSSMKPEYFDTYKKIFIELKDLYAESIDIILHNNVEYDSIPTIEWLRSKFKSIYD